MKTRCLDFLAITADVLAVLASPAVARASTITFSDLEFGFQTFAFNSTFTNLVSVDFGPQSYPFFQFDNIVVGSPTPVPEPVSALLFGSGLSAAALRLRRRTA